MPTPQKIEKITLVNGNFEIEEGVNEDLLSKLGLEFQSSPFFPLTKKEEELVFKDSEDGIDIGSAFFRQVTAELIDGAKYIGFHDFDFEDGEGSRTRVLINRACTSKFCTKIAQSIPEAKKEEFFMTGPRAEYDISIYLPLKMFESCLSLEDVASSMVKAIN